MKKITSLLAIALAACSLCTLVACSSTYDVFEDGAFEMGYSEERNDAFAGTYRWSGQLDDLDIVVPNTFKGAPVTTLGGIVGGGYPLSFYIQYTADLNTDWNSHFGQEFNNTSEVNELLSERLLQDGIENYIVEEITFNIYIGSNLQKFYRVGHQSFRYYGVNAKNNDMATVYLYSFNLIVDKDNSYFYSDDLGRMYYKEDDTLVTYFLYHNRDSFPDGSLPTE